MKTNVGTIDRIFRAVLGLVLLYLAFFTFTSGTATIIAAIVGLVMLATAAMRSCLLYTIFGIKTCKA